MDRICGSDFAGPNWICLGPALMVIRSDIAGFANSFIARSSSAWPTVGSRVATGSSTVAGLPVCTWARYASRTEIIDRLTSSALPTLPGTSTALPGSNLIVPSLAEPEAPARSVSATPSFSSSTGITGSASRSPPKSEPITDTGL